MKNFINGLKLISALGKDFDLETTKKALNLLSNDPGLHLLRRALQMMDETKLGKIAQLSATLGSQVQHNRQILLALKDMEDTKIDIDIIATWVKDHK